jgi:hypothetical protein
MASTISFGYPHRSRSQQEGGSGLLRAKPLLWCVLLLIVGIWFTVRNFSQPADSADLLLIIAIIVQLCIMRMGSRK